MMWIVFALEQWLREFELKERHPVALYVKILSGLEREKRYDEVKKYLEKGIREHGPRREFLPYWRYLGCDGLPILFSRPLVRKRIVKELRKVKRDSLLILLECSPQEYRHFFIVPLLEKKEKEKAVEIFLSSPVKVLSPEEIKAVLLAVEGEEFRRCFEHVSKTKRARFVAGRIFSGLVSSERFEEAEVVYSKWKKYIGEEKYGDAVKRLRVSQLIKEGKFEECMKFVQDKVEEALVWAASGNTKKAWDVLSEALRMGKDVPGDLLLLLKIADPEEVSRYAGEKLTGEGREYRDPWIRYIKGEPDTLSFLRPFYLYREAKELWKEGKKEEAKKKWNEVLDEYPLTFPGDLSRNLMGL